MKRLNDMEPGDLFTYYTGPKRRATFLTVEAVNGSSMLRVLSMEDPSEGVTELDSRGSEGPCVAVCLGRIDKLVDRMDRMHMM